MHVSQRALVSASVIAVSQSVIIVFITLQNQSAPSQLTPRALVSASAIASVISDFGEEKQRF
jgi:hypothetical protein